MPSDKQNHAVLTSTISNGCPISDPKAMLKMEKFGPNLLQDHHLADLFAHVRSERIPERVVYAKGTVNMAILKLPMMYLAW
ncbi:unnamed protein product [Debaryomyces tyrocola]|nr:unnamed protein product [Debaryomyces tyrocola]